MDWTDKSSTLSTDFSLEFVVTDGTTDETD